MAKKKAEKAPQTALEIDALQDAIHVINSDPSRETAASPLIVASCCKICGNIFPQQPQDRNRAEKYEHPTVCQRRTCRAELQKERRTRVRTKARTRPEGKTGTAKAAAG